MSISLIISPTPPNSTGRWPFLWIALNKNIVMKRLMKIHSKKLILLFLFIVVVLFGVVQLDNQPLEGRPVTSEIKAPPEIVAILERSCYNCHSNKTTLNWYDKLAPLSWLVKKDVERAREVMNFSEWENIPHEAHVGKMWAVLNMVKAEKMPLKGYTLLHPEAKVSAAELETIKNYVLSLTHEKIADKNKITTDSKKRTGPAKRNIPKSTPQSPNGITYTAEFKNWKAISMSTLYDNSMRVIYGNDIAVQAIEKEEFHPWPDGAIVVKAVWKQVENEYGEVRAGDFLNAQFMVKDAERFKDTEGWGFAKFSTDELIPTGKTALFAAQSCIACHRQLAKETGYLFNVPLKVNPKK